MRQLDLFSALQSSTEGIDTEFKSARSGMSSGPHAYHTGIRKV
jgi:hypothetical protein